jgi:hypothetical protein
LGWRDILPCRPVTFEEMEEALDQRLETLPPAAPLN